MKKLCLIGDPVDHSLSPRIQRCMIEKTGTDAVYETRQLRREELADFVRRAKAGEWDGFNVTMPYKEAIVPLLDGLSGTAERCGAVNTVCIENGKAIGHNTDGLGFVESLTVRGFDPAGKTALLIGTGGAGEAIADALVQAGIKKIYLCNRSVYRAKALAARYPEQTEFIYFGTFPVRRSAAQADLVINATSLGMSGGKDFSDLRFLRGINPGAIVYDLVYEPRKTQFLVEAEKWDLQTVSGIELLIHQAMLAFRRWTGAEFDVSEMRREIEQVL